MPQAQDLCLSPVCHPLPQLLIIWVTVILLHTLLAVLPWQGDCALIKYMSNLITESHFGDLFSGTNPDFIYCVSQLPSSKWMIYSKGSLMKGHWQGREQVVTDKKWYSSWLVRVECCYHSWLEDARGSCLLDLGAEDVKKAIQQNLWLLGEESSHC